MTLNDFAGWAGYGLALTGIAAAGLFLVAAGGGFAGWAVIADWPHWPCCPGPPRSSAASPGTIRRCHSTPPCC